MQCHWLSLQVHVDEWAVSPTLALGIAFQHCFSVLNFLQPCICIKQICCRVFQVHSTSMVQSHYLPVTPWSHTFILWWRIRQMAGASQEIWHIQIFLPLMGKSYPEAPYLHSSLLMVNCHQRRLHLQKCPQAMSQADWRHNAFIHYSVA